MKHVQIMAFVILLVTVTVNQDGVENNVLSPNAVLENYSTLLLKALTVQSKSKELVALYKVPYPFTFCFSFFKICVLLGVFQSEMLCENLYATDIRLYGTYAIIAL